jgi:hypothetical protein
MSLTGDDGIVFVWFDVVLAPDRGNVDDVTLLGTVVALAVTVVVLLAVVFDIGFWR